MQNFLKHVFANQIQECIERSLATMKLALFQRCNNDLCKSINVINYLKGIKDRNYMVFSIHEEKFWQN